MVRNNPQNTNIEMSVTVLSKDGDFVIEGVVLVERTSLVGKLEQRCKQDDMFINACWLHEHSGMNI